MKAWIISGRLALRGLWRYRVRAALMMAGMTVGITALTVLNALGEGTRQETLRRFRNMLGTFDTVVIRPGAGRTRGMVSLSNVPPTLKFEDARALASAAREVREVALVQNAFDIDVKYRDRLASPAVFGVSANWSGMRGDEAAQGNLLTPGDVDSLARVAVLGGDVAEVLFPDERAVGKTIRIAEVPFTVKGVLKRRGAAPGGASLDDIIDIPITTAAKRLFNRDYLTMVLAKVRDPAEPETAVADIREQLRQRHHLAPNALDDFTLTNPRAMMARVNEMRSTLQKILTDVAICVTLLGGAMILGVMLSSVTERRREIGVRRALGASSTHVLVHFFCEALWSAAIAGFTGIAAGTALTLLISGVETLPARVAPDMLAWEIGFSVGLGVACGLYPAWRAARVDPVRALRA